MTQVAAAATQYGIDGRELLKPGIPQGSREPQFSEFMQAVQQLLTSLELAISRDARATVLVLAPSHIFGIRKTLAELRDRLANADFPAKKTTRIQKLINEIEAELAGRGFDLGKTLALFAAIATIVNQGEQAIIHLPETIATVVTLATTGLAGAEHPSLEGPAEVLKLEDQREI